VGSEVGLVEGSLVGLMGRTVGGCRGVLEDTGVGASVGSSVGSNSKDGSKVGGNLEG